MLRHIGFLGVLALFSAVAFVQPGQGQAMRLKEVGEMVPRRVSFHDIDSVIPLVTRFSQVDHLLMAKNVATRSIVKSISSQDSVSDAWRVIASNSDPSLQRVFLEIDWAREKNDRATCSSLSIPPPSDVAPSKGDWIAYCFARVTRNADRCSQISDTRKPDLRTICSKEFSHTESLPLFLATLLP